MLFIEKYKDIDNEGKNNVLNANKQIAYRSFGSIQLPSSVPAVCNLFDCLLAFNTLFFPSLSKFKIVYDFSFLFCFYLFMELKA